jgi:phage shock protein PspC (stress-responsive transcriptional regulator)
MKRIISLLIIVCFISVTTIGCGGKISTPKAGDPPKMGRVITGDNNIFGGVCSGLAYFTGTPVWAWRAGFVVTSLLVGGGVVVYIILWCFMPYYENTPPDFQSRTNG